MEYGNWTPEDWETLLYTIYRQNCILMLGPDAAVEKVDGQFRPLTELLAHELAQKLRPEIREYVDPSNLAQVAQYYRLEHARNDLEAKVHHFYTSKKFRKGKAQRSLSVMPAKIKTLLPICFSSLKPPGFAPGLIKKTFAAATVGID